MINPLPLFRVVQKRGNFDCAICCLAMLLGESYENVLIVAARVSETVEQEGLWLKEIREIAAELGTPLKALRRYDRENDYGILNVNRKSQGHVVMLRNGLVFDPEDGCVWDADDFLADGGWKAGTLLVVEDK